MLDERNNRLLLQIQACADNLVVDSGVLGLLRNAGKAAPQIAAAVQQAARNTCARRALRPACNSLRSGEAVADTVDEPSVENILEHVVLYVFRWRQRAAPGWAHAAPGL